MQSKKHITYKLMALTMFLLTAPLSGCVSIMNPYDGKPVSENNIIPLKQGGPHEGNWETKQVGFKYTYTNSGNMLNISGLLSCYVADHYKFELVDNLFFRVTFVDSDANLIGSKVIWSLTNDNHEYKWQIRERTVALPPNAVAVGFSYTGSVREAGGNRGTDEGGLQIDLWYSPLGDNPMW